MSTPSPGAVWQRPDLVTSFLDRRQILVPLLDVQEDIIRRLLQRHDHAVASFLDVGCGDGAMAELVLSMYPDAQAVLVDFSEPMLERAHARLAGSRERCLQVRGDLSEPAWHERLPGAPFDAVVSGLAIHHLPSERKRALFAECFELLRPGGMFVNMDYVSVAGPLRGLFDEQMLANAARAQPQHGTGRGDHGLDLDDDDDRPDPAEAQVQWLRDAGFEDAEVHFKWAEAAVFGAIKPQAVER